MAQGVLSGTADAAFLGYTFGKMLQSKGFRVLADSEKLPIPYQGSGVIAKRSFVTASPGSLENLLRALLESAAFIRNPENKSQVTKSLARALRFKRVEDAEDGYQSMINLYERKIYPSVDGIRNVIRLLGMVESSRCATPISSLRREGAMIRPGASGSRRNRVMLAVMRCIGRTNRSSRAT